MSDDDLLKDSMRKDWWKILVPINPSISYQKKLFLYQKYE